MTLVKHILKHKPYLRRKIHTKELTANTSRGFSHQTERHAFLVIQINCSFQNFNVNIHSLWKDWSNWSDELSYISICIETFIDVLGKVSSITDLCKSSFMLSPNSIPNAVSFLFKKKSEVKNNPRIKLENCFVSLYLANFVAKCCV